MRSTGQHLIRAENLTIDEATRCGVASHIMWDSRCFSTNPTQPSQHDVSPRRFRICAPPLTSMTQRYLRRTTALPNIRAFSRAYGSLNSKSRICWTRIDDGIGATRNGLCRAAPNIRSSPLPQRSPKLLLSLHPSLDDL